MWNSDGTRNDKQSAEGKTRADISGETVVYIGQDGYIGITNDLDRRTAEWAREGRTIRELTRTPDRETARGVEQILIEEGRAKENKTNIEQHNSIDPQRTDERAERMREKGRDFVERWRNPKDK